MLAETTTDIFLTTAEVGIALVGFTGIVLAITRQRSHLSAAEAIQLKGIVVFGIATVFLAFLPLCLSLGQFDATQIWRISSGVHGAGVLLVPFPLQIREFRALPREHREALLYLATFVLPPVAIVIQLSNAFGYPFAPNAMAYFIGILMPLITAAAFFLRLLISKIIA